MQRITKQSRISIVGAGISGLSLAIMLGQKGFQSVRIFEKDQSFDSRRQGYGLTILQGKSALRRLGVLEQAKLFNAPSKAHYIFNQKGQILGFYGTLFWDSSNENRSLRSKQKGLSMHIPRQSLRKVLLDKVYQTFPNQIIKWNSNLNSVSYTKDKVCLKFESQHEEESDLVIGCDGIYSNLRKHAFSTNENIRYLGILVVLGLCGSDHPLTKERVFQTADGEARLFSMPFIKDNPNLSTMWQLSMPINWAQAQFYSKNEQELKKYILQKCKNWHEPIPSLIQSTISDNLMGIPAFDRQPKLDQLISKRVILMGDSAHPMSPFKGQGANQALLDAVELSDMIEDTEIEQFSNKFHSLMMKRVEGKVLQSRERVVKYHNPAFTEIDNFLYPRIDKKLIDLLKMQEINYSSGPNIEDKIITLMKRHKYLV